MTVEEQDEKSLSKESGGSNVGLLLGLIIPMLILLVVLGVVILLLVRRNRRMSADLHGNHIQCFSLTPSGTLLRMSTDLELPPMERTSVSVDQSTYVKLPRAIQQQINESNVLFQYSN